LWIIRLSISIAVFQKDKISSKVKIPWFIGLFVLAIISAYLIPQYQTTFNHFHWLGSKIMVIALFLIGSNISIREAKSAGFRSFALGILLWIIIATLSFFVLTAKI